MDIAAYYFPNYHADKRNEAYHGKNWTEWNLMKCSIPRFAGHRQPKIPLWGYEDEADPQVMARKIDAAARCGLNAFVFDWYWYDGAYLQRALDEGFLQAPNRDKLKFALMWANHDWYDRHPIGFETAKNAKMLYRWSSTKSSIGFVWDYIIENYMTRPEYWYVDGLPYFSIYAVNRFISQMGGVEDAAEVLADFRAKAVKAGLPGVHINAVWYDNLDSQPFCVCPQKLWHEKIGFSSYTSYNSVGATKSWQEMKDFEISFATNASEYKELAYKASGILPAPYFPVVTAGWDSSPRTIQSETYQLGPYPYLPVMEMDPVEFGKALHDMAEVVKNRPEAQQIIFINAWNEWTEGSYIEPDTVFGYDYFKAIREFTGK